MYCTGKRFCKKKKGRKKEISLFSPIDAVTFFLILFGCLITYLLLCFLSLFRGMLLWSSPPPPTTTLISFFLVDVTCLLLLSCSFTFPQIIRHLANILLLYISTNHSPPPVLPWRFLSCCVHTHTHSGTVRSFILSYITYFWIKAKKWILTVLSLLCILGTF